MQRIGRDLDQGESGLALLRQRMAEVEEVNQDLLAYARGHAGVVSAVHEAVLAALAADTIAALATIVTRDWPCLLGVDFTAMAWACDGQAFAADAHGLRAFEPRLVARMAGMERAVTVRQVGRGHPLFGDDAALVRAEVTIRMEGARGIGVVLLGQREGAALEAPAGGRLLRFLGRTAATMLERWPTLDLP